MVYKYFSYPHCICFKHARVCVFVPVRTRACVSWYKVFQYKKVLCQFELSETVDGYLLLIYTGKEYESSSPWNLPHRLILPQKTMDLNDWEVYKGNDG